MNDTSYDRMKASGRYLLVKPISRRMKNRFNNHIVIAKICKWDKSGPCQRGPEILIRAEREGQENWFGWVGVDDVIFSIM